MGKTSITSQLGDEKDTKVKVDINFQRIEDRSLFSKRNTIRRGPNGKQCVTVNSIVLEDSGERVLYDVSERINIDEEGVIIPSNDVEDWLIDDEGNEIRVTEFEANMKSGNGINIDVKVPREMMNAFVIDEIYEIVANDDTQRRNLWKIAKDLWDNHEIGVITKVVLKSGYTTNTGLLVPYINEEDGVFYVELLLSTKKREPKIMEIPSEDDKKSHVQILVNPMVKNNNTIYTLEEPEPWVDMTWIPPGDYSIIDINHDTVTIIADVYDDREGKLLNAKNQEVTINYHNRRNNPIDLNSLSREDFIKELVDMELPYTDVQGLVMTYVMVNKLSPIDEDDILVEYQNFETVRNNPVSDVVTEIYRQLGGNKFKVMTGAKDFVGDENTLRFKLRKGTAKDGINLVSITLNSMDLYDVSFQKFNYRTFDIKTIKEFNNIYNDQLKDIFEETTGLHTSLRNNPSSNGRCAYCGKEIPDDWSFALCPSCELEAYVTDISSRYDARRYAEALELLEDFYNIHPKMKDELNRMLVDKGIDVFVMCGFQRMRNNPSVVYRGYEIEDNIDTIIIRHPEGYTHIHGWDMNYDSGIKNPTIEDAKEFIDKYIEQLDENESEFASKHGITNPTKNLPEIGDIVEIEGKEYVIMHKYKPSDKVKQPYRVRLNNKRSMVSYFTALDINDRFWSPLISLGANPGVYSSEKKLYEQKFGCPECGERVCYKSWIHPSTYDEPGSVEDELIERDCKSDCKMEDWELEEIGREIDTGDFVDPDIINNPSGKITVYKEIPANELDSYQLVQRIKAMYPDIDRQSSYSRFVELRGLKPEIDAKEVFNIFDSVGPNMWVRKEEIEFTPTHINKYNNFETMFWRDERGLQKFVDEHGGSGSYPPSFNLEEHYHVI
jgi:hypothetical protein